MGRSENMNFTHQPPCLDTLSMYMGEPLHVHRVPYCMAHPNVYHKALNWCHGPQRMVPFHFGYLQMAHQAAFFHSLALAHEIYGAVIPPGFVMLPAQAQFGPQAYVLMQLQPLHAVPLQCHDLQVSPAPVPVSRQTNDLSSRFSEAAQFCISSPLHCGDEAVLDESFPEFTPLEEAPRFFECEPEAEPAQTADLEQREATEDMVGTEDQGLDDDELKASILLLQTLDPSNNMVADEQQASCMDF